MLAVHHLSKTFGITPVLKNITFSIKRGERVGLIGPNGCGKSTLVKIIAGEVLADDGYVTFSPGNVRLGYLAQGLEPEAGQTIAGILAAHVPTPLILEQRLAELALALAHSPENHALQTAYDQTLTQLSCLDAGKTPTLLAAFDLDQLDPNMPVELLSGGQKTRLSLTLILLSKPELLLLDEPTNHLDIGMLEWLETWLADFDGALLIVSHDRAFLDGSVNRILYLNPESQSLQSYEGNYSDYLEQVMQEQEKRWSQYKDQVYEIRRIRQDIARVKEKARRKELATKNDVQRRYAKKVAKLARSREKKLARYLDSDARVTRPLRDWQVDIQFETSHHVGQDVLELVDLAVGYQQEEVLIAGISLHIQAGQRVVLSGPNGAGKTTLLRTLTGQIPPLAGSYRLGHSVRLGYMDQEQALLDSDKTAVEIIGENAGMNPTDARNYLHHYLFKEDEPLLPIRFLSYGERARLLLALLVAQGCNFLLLDEPINHLDIPSRTLFEAALTQFAGTTLTIVHDRYFIDRFATHLWWAEAGSITTHLL